MEWALNYFSTLKTSLLAKAIVIVCGIAKYFFVLRFESTRFVLNQINWSTSCAYWLFASFSLLDQIVLILFLFCDEYRVMCHQVIFDGLQRFQTSLWNATDRIAFVKVKQSNAKCLANVFKDLNRVSWRLIFSDFTLSPNALSVVFRVWISDWGLYLSLQCLLVEFWRQVVDTTTTCIVALQGVAVWQIG